MPLGKHSLSGFSGDGCTHSSLVLQSLSTVTGTCDVLLAKVTPNDDLLERLHFIPVPTGYVASTHVEHHTSPIQSPCIQQVAVVLYPARDLRGGSPAG